MSIDYFNFGGGIVHKTAILSGEVSVGENSRIDAYAVITGTVHLGRYVHIGTGCFVSGANHSVRMDDFSSLSAGVKVFTGSDDYSGYSMTNPTVPSECKPYLRKGAVIIGKHVIVGAGSVIAPGVEIAEGTAVGALSLISSSLEPWGVYAGIPAKWKKARARDLLALEHLA